MNPELEKKLQSLEKQVSDLQANFNALKNAAEYDPLIARSLAQTLTGTSSKLATSENRTVNEAGASSYTVLNAPDGFITLAGKNVPFYN